MIELEITEAGCQFLEIMQSRSWATLGYRGCLIQPFGNQSILIAKWLTGVQYYLFLKVGRI